MAEHKFGWYESFIANGSDLEEGQGVTIAGNQMTLVAADDVCDAVVCHAVEEGQVGTVCFFGEVDVLMAADTAAGNIIRCQDNGSWNAAAATNGIARLSTGGAVGLQKAFFYGRMRLLNPDT